MSITARETRRTSEELPGGGNHIAPHGKSYSKQTVEETNKQFAALKRKQETC